MAQRHTIKATAIRTGLSPHLIRMWEKRYGAVAPKRTSSNRRLYSDDDIYKLTLLRRATESGESIGQVAHLPVKELESLLETVDVFPGRNGHRPAGHQPEPAENIIEQSLETIRELDEQKLLGILMKASSDKSRTEFLKLILDPLMKRVGDLWEDGTLSVAHEHMVTAVVRSLLGSIVVTDRMPHSAPILIATTPEGQDHEFGAMMAAITANAAGWRAVYLGPNVPPEDVAGAVRQSEARAVALSIIYPPDDPSVTMQLRKLRALVGPDVTIITGGRASAGYASTLESINAHITGNLSDLMHLLGRIRSRAPKKTK